MIELELPYPPTINHYYVKGKILGKRGRQYRETVIAIMAVKRVQPIEGPVDIRIDVYMPDRRRRDIDNLQKALLDSLEHGGAYKDDSQISRIEMNKQGILKGGFVRVFIKEWKKRQEKMFV